MKKISKLFSALSLSLLTGIGTLSGITLTNKSVLPTHAASSVNVYYQIASSDIGLNTPYIEIQLETGNDGSWAKSEMSLVNGNYNGMKLYRYSYNDWWDGAAQMYIKDSNNGNLLDNPFTSWQSQSVYNGKIFTHSGSSWTGLYLSGDYYFDATNWNVSSNTTLKAHLWSDSVTATDPVLSLVEKNVYSISIDASDKYTSSIFYVDGWSKQTDDLHAWDISGNLFKSNGSKGGTWVENYWGGYHFVGVGGDWSKKDANKLTYNSSTETWSGSVTLAKNDVAEYMQVDDLTRYAYIKLIDLFNDFTKALTEDDRYQLECQKLTNYIKGCSDLDSLCYSDFIRTNLVLGGVEFLYLDYCFPNKEELEQRYSELKHYIVVKV